MTPFSFKPVAFQGQEPLSICCYVEALDYDPAYAGPHNSASTPGIRDASTPF
jgi:hypothetical protein